MAAYRKGAPVPPTGPVVIEPDPLTPIGSAKSGFALGVVSRPLYYSPALADEICRRVTEGDTIREIAADPSMPTMHLILDWRVRYPDFRARYEQARMDSAHIMEYDMLTVAASATTRDQAACARVRTDAMRYVMGKRSPREYGEKVDVNINHNEVKRLPINLKNLPPEEIANLRRIIALSITQDTADQVQALGLGGPMMDAEPTNDDQG